MRWLSRRPRPSRSPRPETRTCGLRWRKSSPALPDLFEKKDVVQALGWTPSRSSLHRVLSEMERDGFVVFEVLSSGRMPSRYRKM